MFKRDSDVVTTCLLALLGGTAFGQSCDLDTLFEVGERRTLAAEIEITQLHDMDGDGMLDLIVTTHDGRVVIQRGLGAGDFEPWAEFSGIGPFGQGLAAGDLNNDGLSDLVVVSSLYETAQFYLGDGNGVFTQTVSMALGADPREALIKDLDQDGSPDVVIAGLGTDQIIVFWGDGNGGIAGSSLLPTGDGPLYVGVADLDGDGLLDIIVTNFHGWDVQAFLNRGDRAFDAQPRFATGRQPRGLVLRDFDDDGDIDLATSNFDGGDVYLHWNDGTGEFSVGAVIPTGFGAHHIVSEDFDGDGHLDLVVGNAGPKTLSFIPGGPGQSFGAPVNFPIGSEMEWLRAAPLIPGHGPSLIMHYRFTGDYALVRNTCSICRADLSGDGDVDSFDFFTYLDLFAEGNPRADIDGNGIIDADDFFGYLDLFVEGC